MARLLLVDAHGLIYRFFHALPPLTDREGNLAQALYGLSGVLLRIAAERKYGYAAAAFDRPEPTFRKKAFQGYKEHRAPAAEGLIPQLIRAPEVFSAFGVSSFSAAGYEADDVLGTIVERFSGEENLEIVILSGDLDLLQLVRGTSVQVEIIKSGLTVTELYDEARVIERYGIPPRKLPDLKGFIGDTSDNIPGVKGVGPKTASELIREFGTVEGVYENLPLIPQKVAKKLEAEHGEALMSRDLARIKRDVPIDLPGLAELVFAPPKPEELRAYLEGMGFASLVERAQT
jgi:DNA polymerase-1